MTDRQLELAWLPGEYAVCRLSPAGVVPAWAMGASGFVSITRTAEELSIVAPTEAVPDDVRAERGWAAMRVAGTLDFSEVGILARLTTALADAGVSVFAVSTFDTDYLLVRTNDITKVPESLRGIAAVRTRQP